MKFLLFTFSMVSFLPSLAWSEIASPLIWPQPEAFYDSKAATPSRRMIEPAVTNGYAYPAPVASQMPAIVQMPFYPAPMGYLPSAPAIPQGFPNSPSGFLPMMPQGFPSSLPSFSAPTITVPSMPNAMPNYGSMPFSPMPSMGGMPFNSGSFPSNSFGNMMPFPSGNSFSGMPFGFGY